jgi:hypothetical protein
MLSTFFESFIFILSLKNKSTLNIIDTLGMIMILKRKVLTLVRFH